LSRAEIEAADAVIFAHDLPVKDIARFAGKPVIDVGVKKGISDGPQLIEDAAKAAAAHRANPGRWPPSLPVLPLVVAAGWPARSTPRRRWHRIRQWLMTGVST
jgi:PTS system fructose-specific IIC component